jgi:hypothetical protein
VGRRYNVKEVRPKTLEKYLTDGENTKKEATSGSQDLEDSLFQKGVFDSMIYRS